jgi:hypothetical protein
MVGRKTFGTRFPVCHGLDGSGGEMGPGIAQRVRELTEAQIKESRRGAARVQSQRHRDGAAGVVRSFIIRLTNRRRPEGKIISEPFDEAPLRTEELRIHLLRQVAGGRFREVTSEADWTT